MPLQFKGSKCNFIFLVLTQQELETCRHFDMTSDHEWYLESIKFNNICNIPQARSIKSSVFQVQWDGVYLSSLSDLIEGVYVYQDPTSDEVILSEINTSLFQIKELCISQINIQGHDNKQFPARRIFSLGSDNLILHLNPCINSVVLVPRKRNFWRTLKMKQYPPSYHLVEFITQITCIISSAYEDGLQLMNLC